MPEAATNTGPGRLLVAVYVPRHLGDGPVHGAVGDRLRRGAAGIPALAVRALVYIVATVSLARRPGRDPGGLGGGAGGAVGVLTVGTLTVLDPDLFPDATVWSTYGQGYGFVPLVLPLLGLAWLWHVSRSRR